MASLSVMVVVVAVGGDGRSSGDSHDTWDLDMLDAGPHFTADLHS